MEKGSNIELPQKQPQEPEVETWEDEGRVFETQEEELTPETVVEETKVQRSWQELIIQAKEEFPEEIKVIINKTSRKENLTPKEAGALDSFSYHWFRETFGIKPRKRPPKKNYQKKSWKP